MKEIRNDWTKQQVSEIFHLPLLELVHKASQMHRKYHDASKIKVSQLISIKTGACVEDCAYCAQSSRYKTAVQSHKTLSLKEVLEEAASSKSSGVERVCLSASWREIPDGKQFDELLEMITKVKELGLSVCCTTGMMNKEQAGRLAKAGITAYNHNLDTSDEFYSQIITTRSYEERLDTIDRLIDAGVQHCTGGIIGLGESEDDRIAMIHKLATLKKHPYTVPLNTLVPIPGTPLEDKPMLKSWEMIRMIATVRMVMPQSMICLAAGRKQMTAEGQALCFLSGANSIFVGTKLLTTPNPELNDDIELLGKLGLEKY
ncbi:MAG: biotin synthase BioB [Bacteroidales bacterium]|jgi:biotin synthase